jgi:hypothetical protein
MCCESEYERGHRQTGISPDREAGSLNKEMQMSETLAEKYKQQLATRTEEQETVSPLWEQPPYNDCDLIQEDGELAVQFEDRSVYSYENGEAYTAAEWLGQRDGMTYAEQSKASQQRDDEHMIYEMLHMSHYSDGSVLDCKTMTALTAQQIVGMGVPDCDKWGGTAEQRKFQDIFNDLRRNAKAALKNGTTRNLAPRVR